METAPRRSASFASRTRRVRVALRYALSATAFALLTGSPPSGVLPSWNGIDPAQAEQLEAAIRLGLATDPGRRPVIPGELVERLRAGWGAALPTGLLTFCLSDIEGSTSMSAVHARRPPGDRLSRRRRLVADRPEAVEGPRLPGRRARADCGGVERRPARPAVSPRVPGGSRQRALIDVARATGDIPARSDARTTVYAPASDQPRGMSIATLHTRISVVAPAVGLIGTLVPAALVGRARLTALAGPRE